MAAKVSIYGARDDWERYLEQILGEANVTLEVWNQNRNQWRPLPTETFEEWISRVGPEFQKLGVDLNRFSPNRFYTVLGTNPDIVRDNKIKRDVDEFYREMTGPLDMNDPEIQRIMADVRGRAGTDVFNTGWGGGGLADTAVARALSDAALNISQQRKSLGAQMMQAALDDSATRMRIQQQADAMNADIAYQNALREYESQSNLFRVGGGILGGLAGGAFGLMAGGGPLTPTGWAGAGLGASTGAQIGAGLGGSLYGPPPAQPQMDMGKYRGGY